MLCWWRCCSSEVIPRWRRWSRRHHGVYHRSSLSPRRRRIRGWDGSRARSLPGRVELSIGHRRPRRVSVVACRPLRGARPRAGAGGSDCRRGDTVVGCLIRASVAEMRRCVCVFGGRPHCERLLAYSQGSLVRRRELSAVSALSALSVSCRLLARVDGGVGVGEAAGQRRRRFPARLLFPGPAGIGPLLGRACN